MNYIIYMNNIFFINYIIYMNYEKKYLKYKAKYIKYKIQFGGINRFTLIIKRRYIPDEYGMPYYNYDHFIVDNLKPENIYSFDKEERFFPKGYDNIVARYFDQHLEYPNGLKVVPEIIWPEGLMWYEIVNKNYRLENVHKFVEKIDEIKKKKKEGQMTFPINHNELLKINFD